MIDYSIISKERQADIILRQSQIRTEHNIIRSYQYPGAHVKSMMGNTKDDFSLPCGVVTVLYDRTNGTLKLL